MHRLHAIAHVTCDASSELSFRHLRVFSACIADNNESKMRASITAANDFIFPYYTSSTTNSSKRPRSTNITTNNNNTPATRMRRLRDRFRLSSPLPMGISRRRDTDKEYGDIENDHDNDSDAHSSSVRSYRRPPHVFAITHPDGSHEYCFCKHLSPTDALLIVAAVPTCAFYMDVLERCSQSWFTLSNITLSSTSSTTTSARSSTTSTSSPMTSEDSAADDSSPMKNPLLTFGHLNDNITSTWLTSHIHSLIIGDLSLYSVQIDQSEEDEHWIPSDSNEEDSNNAFPSPLHHTLADVPLLLQHVSPRSIALVLGALMDERRVAVVGSSVAIVSRIVLALYNILSPFEWPHLLSPVLPEKHAAVLGTPFPYLIGTSLGAVENGRDIMDGTLLLHIESGDTEVVGDEYSENEFEALFSGMPRLAKLRLERRLAKIRARLNINLDNSNNNDLENVCYPAQYAVHCFFKNVLAERNEESKARRHRSFGTRGVSDVGNGNRNVRRNLSWAANLHNATNNTVDIGLCTRFERTQMYLQWNKRPDADRTFGIASRRTKQAAALNSMVDLLSPLPLDPTDSHAFLSAEGLGFGKSKNHGFGNNGIGNNISTRRPLTWNARASIMMRAKVMN